MRPAPIFLTLALAVAGAGEAAADRFSRPLCKMLQVEYADALTTGARADMEQGPNWAETNLPRERMQNIQRLIDLEAELEFRCSLSRKRIAAIKPERKPLVPDVPEQKPDITPQKETAKAELKAGAASETSAAAPQEPAKAETAAITPQSPPAKERQAVAKPVVQAPAAPSATAKTPTSKPGQPTAQPTAQANAQQAKKPARTKKTSRASNAYVSPREVDSFGLYRNGANW